MASAEGEHEVGGLYVRATLSCVQRACGDEGVARLLDLTGERLDDLPDDAGWISLPRMQTLAAAAATVTGVDEVGRLVGEEIFNLGLDLGHDQAMRATGGPAEAIGMLVSMGSRMSGGWTLEVTGVGEHHAVIESRSPLGLDSTFWCRTGLGYYPRVPTVFGLWGSGAHPHCLVRGDDRCEYVIRWEQGERRLTGPSHDSIRQLENLQATAAKLAAAPDPESVVHLAVGLATDVNIGRRFLVAATLGDASRREVAHHGFDDPDAVALAVDQIEHGARQLDDGLGSQVCVARVTTPRADYGWIASLHPPRSTIDELVERPLAAFADHIASAIEAALVLESAQRDRDIAHALVALARQLAGATAADDVASLVESALAGSTACVDTRVWLLEPDGQMLCQVGRGAGASARLPLTLILGVGGGDRTVTVAEELGHLHPGADQVSRCSLVPLVVRGERIGVVAVGWPAARPPCADELALVEGIVDQAALAFDVVGLLADLQRQARHDSLSGLPNRALLAERAELALAQAARSGRQVGVLFVDLDHFKTVNDAHGHTAGDEVICEVARRLRSTVRAHDTVARLGGDEFVVLVTECVDERDAANAAQRVRDVMAEPFHVAGRELEVSATVGVVAARAGELTWHALLDRADAAMYRGKRHGRAGIAIS